MANEIKAALKDVGVPILKENILFTTANNLRICEITHSLLEKLWMMLRL